MPAAEILVVDDLSPVPYAEREDVRVVRREVNGGFGAAVNSGAALASGSHLLILNSDLTVTETFLENLWVAAVPWQPAVCGPLLVGDDGQTQWGGRHFPRAAYHVIEWLTPLARYRSHLHEAIGHDTRCVPGAVVPVDWVVGAAMLIPVNVFRDVGGFDETYHMNSEEVDLQRRLREQGIPSVFLGSVSVTHEGGGSSDPGQRRRWVTQSRLWYARKWHEGPGRLRVALIAASLVNLLANVTRLLAGRNVAPLGTFRDELSYLFDRHDR